MLLREERESKCVCIKKSRRDILKRECRCTYLKRAPKKGHSTFFANTRLRLTRRVQCRG